MKSVSPRFGQNSVPLCFHWVVRRELPLQGAGRANDIRRPCTAQTTWKTTIIIKINNVNLSADNSQLISHSLIETILYISTKTTMKAKWKMTLVQHYTSYI